MAYVRTVKTASGATAVQIVYSSRRGVARGSSTSGPPTTSAELEALKAAAAQRLAGGQQELELEVGAATVGPRCPGVGAVADRGLADGASVGRAVPRLRRARVRPGRPAGTRCSGTWCWRGSSSRPASSTACGCSARSASSRRAYAPSIGACRPTPAASGGSKLAAACAAHAALGPASLVLYDVSTLYFETDTGDGFREPGFSKERRLEPQITIGLLTDATGFPLMVEAFEGNRAETNTMLPTITAFMAAHQLATSPSSPTPG